jgi:alcohol dehydrogenase (cytochrome c)
MAFDANTGQELWSFQTTVAATGQPPPKAGGGLWSTYTLDPKTGEVFAGVANPYPDFGRTMDQPGAIAFTNSVIAVDAATGRLNWHYQAVPHDEHDWDRAAAPMLYRTTKDGDGKSMVAITDKSGRVYSIDRSSMIPVFNTPGTTLLNDDIPLAGDWMQVCPGLQGGAIFNGTAYDPNSCTLYVGMNDHCAWYITIPSATGYGGDVIKDWAAAAKRQAPVGWITAIDGQSGRVLWQYQTESQVLAGLVTTKSGLLFGGDTHGNLLAFNAKTGQLLSSVDAGGALNSGLISYAVAGQQYVAAAVGGATENPSTVAGPLKVSIYGLQGPEQPKVVQLDRLNPPAISGISPEKVMYIQNCQQCHGGAGAGGSAPPLARQSQLAEPALLKQFLQDQVLPLMPHLYPGVLMDKDIEMIADYLRTAVFNCGPNEPQRCAPPVPPASGGTAAPGVPFTGSELCAQLKDKTRNGNRSLSDILEHLTNEPLVNWAFNPGIRPNGEPRTTPPIGHAALIQAFGQWMTEGPPCPSN